MVDAIAIFASKIAYDTDEYHLRRIRQISFDILKNRCNYLDLVDGFGNMPLQYAKLLSNVSILQERIELF